MAKRVANQIRHDLAAALMIVAGVGGCATTTMHPPARSNGVMLSNEGVLFGVTEQQCSERRFGRSATQLDGTFTVEVGNPTPVPVTVYPARLLLRARSTVAVRPSTRDGSLTAEGGTTVPVTVRFSAPGVRCSDELTLDPRLAIEWDGHPIDIPAARFVPVEATNH